MSFVEFFLSIGSTQDQANEIYRDYQKLPQYNANERVFITSVQQFVDIIVQNRNVQHVNKLVTQILSKLLKIVKNSEPKLDISQYLNIKQTVCIDDTLIFLHELHQSTCFRQNCLNEMNYIQNMLETTETNNAHIEEIVTQFFKLARQYNIVGVITQFNDSILGNGMFKQNLVLRIAQKVQDLQALHKFITLPTQNQLRAEIMLFLAQQNESLMQTLNMKNNDVEVVIILLWIRETRIWKVDETQSEIFAFLDRNTGSCFSTETFQKLNLSNFKISGLNIYHKSNICANVVFSALNTNIVDNIGNQRCAEHCCRILYRIILTFPLFALDFAKILISNDDFFISQISNFCCLLIEILEIDLFLSYKNTVFAKQIIPYMQQIIGIVLQKEISYDITSLLKVLMSLSSHSKIDSANIDSFLYPVNAQQMCNPKFLYIQTLLDITSTLQPATVDLIISSFMSYSKNDVNVTIQSIDYGNRKSFAIMLSTLNLAFLEFMADILILSDYAEMFDNDNKYEVEGSQAQFLSMYTSLEQNNLTTLLNLNFKDKFPGLGSIISQSEAKQEVVAKLSDLSKFLPKVKRQLKLTNSTLLVQLLLVEAGYTYNSEEHKLLTSLTDQASWVNIGPDSQAQLLSLLIDIIQCPSGQRYEQLFRSALSQSETYVVATAMNNIKQRCLVGDFTMILQILKQAPRLNIIQNHFLALSNELDGCNDEAYLKVAQQLSEFIPAQHVAACLTYLLNTNTEKNLPMATFIQLLKCENVQKAAEKAKIFSLLPAVCSKYSSQVLMDNLTQILDILGKLRTQDCVVETASALISRLNQQYSESAVQIVDFLERQIEWIDPRYMFQQLLVIEIDQYRAALSIERLIVKSVIRFQPTTKEFETIVQRLGDTALAQDQLRVLQISLCHTMYLANPTQCQQIIRMIGNHVEAAFPFIISYMKHVALDEFILSYIEQFLRKQFTDTEKKVECIIDWAAWKFGDCSYLPKRAQFCELSTITTMLVKQVLVLLQTAIKQPIVMEFITNSYLYFLEQQPSDEKTTFVRFYFGLRQDGSHLLAVYKQTMQGLALESHLLKEFLVAFGKNAFPK